MTAKPLELLLPFLLLAGCAAPAAAPKAAHSSPFPQRIALLPMDNQSTDLRGPELVRELLKDSLDLANFDLAANAEIDEKLRSIGISEGGQLNAVTPQKLGELLGVDALIYGDLTEFSNANVGVYSNRTVEAALKLVDAKTGEKLWEATKRKADSKLGLSKDAAVSNLKSGYAAKALEGLMNSPLLPEAEEAVRLLVKDLVKTRRNW
jgi:hypothetical protein